MTHSSIVTGYLLRHNRGGVMSYLLAPILIAKTNHDLITLAEPYDGHAISPADPVWLWIAVDDSATCERIWLTDGLEIGQRIVHYERTNPVPGAE